MEPERMPYPDLLDTIKELAWIFYTNGNPLEPKPYVDCLLLEKTPAQSETLEWYIHHINVDYPIQCPNPVPEYHRPPPKLFNAALAYSLPVLVLPPTLGLVTGTLHYFLLEMMCDHLYERAPEPSKLEDIDTQATQQKALESLIAHGSDSFVLIQKESKTS
jgi:hypothetical protein